ncbi:MAG: glycerol-3-phosphate 1-O-acyltransferase PlsY [Oceanicaulis sp.]|uniref:glycerol-3-phosphate 1-O-acyltransferase PlsY n=1 Tax=Glycocaulis sp. TaxID=1969725 RepID=UPI0025C1237E|nr:glycerol-3-phosphate 1-O-acyltransferase PlsY [Glycocaulis sp.]MCC5981487.1 glycerol-3-phosphate 1-O-acyltransferase PlsY [Oceanicaulis sp.]MCH8522429.1 glycerol-3-phosphate 1-O-acyltransferase PlsY [Glycocaulis sp.]
MPTELAIILAVIGGYLLGSIPFGLVIVKLAGLGDIRGIGSGNIGATNVLRTGRKDLALATLVLDSGKAGIAALIFTFAISPTAGLVAGGAAFFGHCFPVWLGFKGGKGVATFLGVLLATAWPVGLMVCATWLGMALVFRISSLSALVAAAIAPLLALAFARPDVAVLALFLAALLWWRHKENIARLLKGEEPRVGAKKE